MNTLRYLFSWFDVEIISAVTSTPTPTTTDTPETQQPEKNVLILEPKMSDSNNATVGNGNTNGHANGNNTPKEATFYHNSVELFDLGITRFDQDTAAVGDRDFALHAQGPVLARAGRAPRGLESQVHAWNTFQYTTEEVNEREELKGDLHGGQLHRENRAAANGQGGGGMNGGGKGGFGGGYAGRGGDRGGRGAARGGRAGGAGRGGRDDGALEGLCAGRKPDYDCPPMAKGMAEEMDKSMFWDGPIV
ncbi:uncharacterized protein J4E87_006604 [Alternaria ethzedia]|uniref:uncharacterized protein n=1 Tax=Alternaria ethzedia TaxID=181014 RepID=UPI0020C48B99|nr:uncharacterized protein J4E87_006604 [Alternaria ethzedia]KAI4621388.1 hypothetical protein J4E87_006604 [Alternaria ethzedia]